MLLSDHFGNHFSVLQHDDREGERDKRWVENRGRGRGSFVRSGGRFLFRKAAPSVTTTTATMTTTSTSIGSGNTNSRCSPKWTHNKFKGSAEEGEVPDDDTDQDHKEDGNTGVALSSGQ